MASSVLLGGAALLLLAAPLYSQSRSVSFPTSDGGVIFADSYGAGDRGLVLVHGGRFKKDSWAKQAPAFVAAGFHVLAIDFRGEGQSRGPGMEDQAGPPLHLDVLGAVKYLRQHGAKTVSVVGGSMGGAAAGDASIAAKPHEIDRIVLLAASPDGSAEKLQSATLWIVARDDSNDDGPRLPGIRAQYDKAPQPKKLIVLDGSAHAQFLFDTGQAERVMQEILRFLAPR